MGGVPVNQGIEPGAADFISGPGVDGPAGEVGIAGSDPTRCSSAAGGLGQTSNGKAGGGVEQAQSRLRQARPASGNFLNCTGNGYIDERPLGKQMLFLLIWVELIERLR